MEQVLNIVTTPKYVSLKQYCSFYSNLLFLPGILLDISNMVEYLFSLHDILDATKSNLTCFYTLKSHILEEERGSSESELPVDLSSPETGKGLFRPRMHLAPILN